MKKLEKLFDGRCLVASKGNGYNAQTVKVQASSDTQFVMITSDKNGTRKLVTSSLREVLVTMRDFSPKPRDWHVVK